MHGNVSFTKYFVTRPLCLSIWLFTSFTTRIIINVELWSYKVLSFQDFVALYFKLT